MEKSTKPQSDAKRLQTVLDILGVTAFQLAKELGYKSPASVYNVLGGSATLSNRMALGIIKKYQTVNYVYLTRGKGEPILRLKSEIEAQRNLFGISNSTKNDSDAESPEEGNPSGPNTSEYLSYQIRTLIENSFELNKLVKELIEENRELRKVLADKN